MKLKLNNWQKIWGYLFILFLVLSFFKWQFFLDLEIFIPIYLVFLILFVYIFRK